MDFSLFNQVLGELRRIRPRWRRFVDTLEVVPLRPAPAVRIEATGLMVLDYPKENIHIRRPFRCHWLVLEVSQEGTPQ